mgnify:CR=1 FL=1
MVGSAIHFHNPSQCCNGLIMPQPRLYADGVCHNLQVSCPSQLKDEITALANAQRVSVGVFLVPYLREIVARAHQPIEEDAS